MKHSRPRRPATAFMLAAAALTFLSPALADGPLKMAVGTMSYPLEKFDQGGQISGGLTKEMGELLAAELGTRVVFVKQSRQRIESGLLTGELDISCYTHPTWWDNAQPALWSIATIPQIERVVGLRTTQFNLKVPEGFVGKRVVVHTGYHFPSIQPLFDSGKAKRLNENEVPMLFKAVETKFADILITSDAEIEGYLNEHPEKRKLFSAASEPFSAIPTQCAVSPKSSWSLAKIDRALGAMMKRGDFDRITKKYGMAMQ